MAKDPISPGDGSAITGLAVRNNETIQAFLLLAAADEQRLSGELRDLASDLSSQSSIPYRSLRSIWSALPVGARPSITALFSGAEFPFSSPKPREKSEELKKRLRKLAEMAERKEYEELVKDVAPRKEEAEPFSSYKDQIGFGLHVLVVMFTGYLFGFAAFRALFNHSAVMNAAGGILGMVCGMLLETTLFIIRASGRDMLSSTSTLKRKKQQNIDMLGPHLVWLQAGGAAKMRGSVVWEMAMPMPMRPTMFPEISHPFWCLASRQLKLLQTDP